MSKLSKEELARFSGAEWMLRYIKEHGIEEAEKELTNRGIREIPLAAKQQDVDKWYNQERINITNCAILIAVATLYDEYDFSIEKLNQYIHRFNIKAECLSKDYVSWEDLQQTLKEETGLYIPLPERRK